MAADASLLLAEPLVFGRTAMGERLTCGNFRDRIEVRRDGACLFLDAMTLEGDIAAHLALPAVAAGAGAMVSLLYVAKNAEAHLPAPRYLRREEGPQGLLHEKLARHSAELQLHRAARRKFH